MPLTPSSSAIRYRALLALGCVLCSPAAGSAQTAPRRRAG